MRVVNINERKNMNAIEQLDVLCGELGVPKAAPPKAYSPTPDIRCYCPCDFRRLPVKPGSVKAVITDIPYDDEWLVRHGSDFGAWCRQVLVPGGVLATFYGNSRLPKLFAELERYLRYHWVFSSPLSGSVLVRGKWINTHCQLVAVFCNGSTMRLDRAVDDRIPAGRREEKMHDYQKNVAQMQYLVEAFSQPGDSIVDPCAGSWVTAEACWHTHRKFTGSDLDPSCLGLAHRRFQNLLG
jgi:site-specific DNA-methyltransferase (adenine-specific)